MGRNQWIQQHCATPRGASQYSPMILCLPWPGYVFQPSLPQTLACEMLKWCYPPQRAFVRERHWTDSTAPTPFGNWDIVCMQNRQQCCTAGKLSMKTTWQKDWLLGFSTAPGFLKQERGMGLKRKWSLVLFAGFLIWVSHFQLSAF